VAQLALPADISLPVFAYGQFARGEPAYFQIRDFVEGEPSTHVISGALFERDGYAILQQGGQDTVEGSLIRFRADAAEAAYRRICEFEPQPHFKWESVAVDGTVANVLSGRSPGKGSDRYEGSRWHGWRDPYFVEAPRLIRDVLDDVSDFAGPPSDVLRMQMAYMLLWTCIERFLVLRHGPAEPMENVRRLAIEDGFVEGLAAIDGLDRRVRDSRNPENSERLDVGKPIKAALYYYQVRSNVTHRGKASAVRDFKTLRRALVELLDLFEAMVAKAEVDAHRPNGRASRASDHHQQEK